MGSLSDLKHHMSDDVKILVYLPRRSVDVHFSIMGEIFLESAMKENKGSQV